MLFKNHLKHIFTLFIPCKTLSVFFTMCLAVITFQIGFISLYVVKYVLVSS